MPVAGHLATPDQVATKLLNVEKTAKKEKKDRKKEKSE